MRKAPSIYKLGLTQQGTDVVLAHPLLQFAPVCKRFPPLACDDWLLIGFGLVQHALKSRHSSVQLKNLRFKQPDTLICGAALGIDLKCKGAKEEG